MNGSEYKQCRLTVQPENNANMPLPIVGVKRELYFPKAQSEKRYMIY